MSFVQAIKAGYRGYVSFGGRSSRSDFWFWVLYQTIVSVILGALFGGSTMVAADGGFSYNFTGNLVSNLWSLAHFLPGLAVGIRRLHDTDRSGWWTLIALVPLVGWIVLIVFYCQAGSAGSNRFGADSQNSAASF